MTDNTNNSGSASTASASSANLRLWDHECRWSWAIKQAVEEDDELENLCDFDYAQYALICKGDMENAMHRIRGMQQFRQEYCVPLLKASDNVEDYVLRQGLVALQQFIQQQPWLILDVEYEESYGHHVKVIDFACLNPAAAMATPASWRIFVSGLYYVQQLLQGHLGSIRQGIVRICETQGLSWKNFNVDMMRDLNSHFMEFYPSRNKVVSWYHSSTIGNIFHALFKSITGERAKVIRMGCQFSVFDGRLDQLFKTPTPEAAKARLVNKFQSMLMERYRNQRNFVLRQLPTIPPQIPPRDDETTESDDDDDDNENDYDREDGEEDHYEDEEQQNNSDDEEQEE